MLHKRQKIKQTFLILRYSALESTVVAAASLRRSRLLLDILGLNKELGCRSLHRTREQHTQKHNHLSSSPAPGSVHRRGH